MLCKLNAFFVFWVSTFYVNNNLFWNLTVRLLAYLRSPEIAAYDGLPELRTLPPEPREKAKKGNGKKPIQEVE